MSVVLVLCLFLLAAPAQLQAGAASKDFPNLECAGGANIPAGSSGQVNLKLKWKIGGGAGTPSQINVVKTLLAAEGGCQTGSDMAADLMEGICNACITDADCDVFTGLIGPGFCVGQPCCDGVDPGVSNTINMKTSNGVLTLAKIGLGAIKLEAADNAAVPTAIPPIPASLLTNFLHSTNAGNAVGTDLLPNFVMVVARAGGADGTVTVRIDRTSPPQESFAFTTAGKDDLALLRALQDGFATRGITSTLIDNRSIRGVSAAPESYYADALSVSLPANVLKVTLQAPRGFVNQVDTSAIVGLTPTAPALSAWGVALLVGLMLLAGAWFLRRTTTMRINPS